MYLFCFKQRSFKVFLYDDRYQKIYQPFSTKFDNNVIHYFLKIKLFTILFTYILLSTQKKKLSLVGISPLRFCAGKKFWNDVFLYVSNKNLFSGEKYDRRVSSQNFLDLI